MDELFKTLFSDSEIKKEAVHKLKEFVDLEEFETESIQMDVSDIGQGNISPQLFGKRSLELLMSFIQENKCKLNICLIQSSIN